MKYLVASLLVIGLAEMANGQARVPQPVRPVTPLKTHAEAEFETALVAVAKTLSASPAFELKQKSHWTFRLNGETREGTNHFETMLLRPNFFHIAASSDKHPERTLTAIADGKAVTRLFPSAKIYSVDETAKPFDELPDDALTAKTLEGSYITTLIRPDLRSAFLDIVDKVESFAPDKADPSLVTFKLLLDNGKQLLATVKIGANPLLVRLVTSNAIPLDATRAAEMTVDTVLEWNLRAQPAAELFVAKVPEGLAKVEDLMEAMAGSGSAELLGKPVPPLKLKTLEGADFAVSDHVGKGVTMLYFYAGWAAPSADEMPAVNKFFESYANKGAFLYAVDVADSVDEIKKLIAKNGFKAAVLRDEKGEALTALKLGAVPVSILIGKDGTVQGIYKGSKIEVKRHLKADLDALLAGKPLVEKK